MSEEETPIKAARQDKTILLFGETGAGKSTTINALANYLRFETFDQAVECVESVQEAIPSRLTTLDPMTGEPVIVLGSSEDSNECHNELGNSVTQAPRSYSFNYLDQSVTIIDSPGLGDTRGLDVDRENFRKTLTHLKTVNKLDAVLFLIKTTTTRKTATFRHCLSEMLKLLDRKSASKNLIFCFTFCRNSLYGPGDGFDTVRSVLQENHSTEGQVEITLKPDENCFFLDNEAFHYLVAKKRGVPFAQSKEDSYRESWERSSQQFKTLLSRISSNSFPSIDLERIFLQRNLREHWIPACREPIETLKRLITEKQSDLQRLERFVEQSIQLMVQHSNTSCDKLIKSFLASKNYDDESNDEESSENRSKTRIGHFIDSIKRNELNELQVEESLLQTHQGDEYRDSDSELKEILRLKALVEERGYSNLFITDEFNKGEEKQETDIHTINIEQSPSVTIFENQNKVEDVSETDERPNIQEQSIIQHENPSTSNTFCIESDLPILLEDNNHQVEAQSPSAPIRPTRKAPMAPVSAPPVPPARKRNKAHNKGTNKSVNELQSDQVQNEQIPPVEMEQVERMVTESTMECEIVSNDNVIDDTIDDTMIPEDVLPKEEIPIERTDLVTPSEETVALESCSPTLANESEVIMNEPVSSPVENTNQADEQSTMRQNLNQPLTIENNDRNIEKQQKRRSAPPAPLVSSSAIVTGAFKSELPHSDQEINGTKYGKLSETSVTHQLTNGNASNSNSNASTTSSSASTSSVSTSLTEKQKKMKKKQFKMSKIIPKFKKWSSTLSINEAK